jgi:hypothetical protein
MVGCLEKLICKQGSEMQLRHLEAIVLITVGMCIFFRKSVEDFILC